MESRITKINGSDSVESVTVDTNGDIHDIKTDALFVAVGTLPANELVDNTVTTHNGFIITDETMATNIPGVFAAGDIRKKVLRQVITAVADGAVAGEEASKYVNAHKNA